jgi:oligoribonuclease
VKHLLWLDLEMSGLDVASCRILEVAAIVTDLEFNEIDTYEAIVYQPPAVLEAMDDWCTKQHGSSGLTAAVATGRPEAEVEAELAALIGRYWKRQKRAILCGNSIGTDRGFVDAYWPQVAEKLHYRMVDVSSFKVVLNSRYGLSFQKKGSHRALDDIRESIGELSHYLEHFHAEREAASKS